MPPKKKSRDSSKKSRSSSLTTSSTVSKPPESKEIKSPEESDKKKIGEYLKVLKDIKDIELTQLDTVLKAESDERRLNSDENTPALLSYEGRGYCVLPSSLFIPENLSIGSMFADLCASNDITVRLYNSTDTNLRRDFDKSLIAGIWSGLKTDKYQARKRSKTGIQLAACYSFCLRVRGEFQKNLYLTDEALAKDHFFFGNNPKEMNPQTGVEIVYSFAMDFFNLFTADSKNLEELLNILKSLARITGLDSLDTAQFKKTVEANVISFADLTRKYSHNTSEKKKGKKVITGSRMPNKPSRHPLILGVEMEVITRLISPHWEDNSALETSYVEYLRKFGWSQLKKRLDKLYANRWLILNKFAKVTTNRLKEIRTIVPTTSKKKKADVSSEEIKQLIRQRADPIETYFKELTLMLGDQKRIILSKATKSNQLDTAAMDSYIKSHIIDCYTKFFSEEERKTKKIIPVVTQEMKNNLIAEALQNNIRELNAHIPETMHYMKALRNKVNIIKIDNTIANLSGQLENFNRRVGDWLKSDPDMKIACGLALQELYDENLVEELKKFKTKVKEEMDHFGYALKYRSTLTKEVQERLDKCFGILNNWYELLERVVRVL